MESQSPYLVKGSPMEILPPHPLPVDADKFLASLSPVDRELHMMGAEKLGSSYFMERTRQYVAWKKGK
jgi:hypothetical protein